MGHYIDDFITLGATESTECENNVTIIREACEETGLPTETEKNEGPATIIGFLGMELDTEALEIRLPTKISCIG